MSDNEEPDDDCEDGGGDNRERGGEDSEHPDNNVDGNDGAVELAHNPILVYACSQRYVGLHYDDDPDNDIVWQSIGETVERAVEDMIETLNYLPGQLAEIEAEEADCVDVIPLKTGEDDD